MTLYDQYIDDVISNKIIVCDAVKKAIKRHAQDLKNSKSKYFPYYFDPEEADKPIKFVGILNYKKDKKIIVLPWMAFMIANLYGWRKKADKTRRFKRAFLLIARQNTKTLLASALALYDVMSTEDAQSFCIANEMRQARTAFNYAKTYVRNDDRLKEFCVPWANEIKNKTGGFLKPLPAKPEHLDSYRASICLIDEYHEMNSKELIKVITSGQVSRDESLLLIISSAGFHMDYSIYQEYEFGKKVLNGDEQLDDYFYLFYELDKESEINDPQAWIKANPSIGVACTLDGLKSEYETSKISPAERISFQVKNLNWWTKERVNTWLSSDIWEPIQQGNFDSQALSGRESYGGLDLSKINDFSTFTLYFPPDESDDDDRIKVKHFVFIPEDSIDKKTKTDSYQIREWVEKGYVIPTPGKTINYDFLAEYLGDLLTIYRIKEIGVDAYMIATIEEYFEDVLNQDILIPIRQQITHFSPLVKNWEILAVNNGLHDPNPVMEYCLSNATLYKDHNENCKINKGAGRDKRIDLVITSIQAYSRLMAAGKDNLKKRDLTGFYNAFLPEDQQIKKEDQTAEDKKQMSFYELLNLM